MSRTARTNRVTVLRQRLLSLDWASYRWLLHPLAAFLSTRLFIWLAAYLGEVIFNLPAIEGHYHAMPDNVFWDIWGRWDSAFYMSIAAEGYRYIIGEQSNVAFFPVYPLLVSAVTPLVGNSALIAGVIVSHVCLFFALVYLYRLTAFEFGDNATATRAVYYTASFPTAFFFSAVYTESTFILFSIATFYYARQGLWSMAALMGLITSAARIVGVVVFGVVMLEWMRAHGWTISTLYRKEAWLNLWRGLRSDWSSVLVICLIPLGLLSYMTFLYFRIGDPIAFWSVQSAWGRENLGPLAILWRDFQIMINQDYLRGHIWWVLNIDIASFLLAIATSIAIWRKLGESYAIYTLLGVIIPGSSGTGSMARYILVLFPIFMMLAYWGRNATLDRILQIGFAIFLGLFTAVFVNWIFVG